MRIAEAVDGLLIELRGVHVGLANGVNEFFRDVKICQLDIGWDGGIRLDLGRSRTIFGRRVAGSCAARFLFQDMGTVPSAVWAVVIRV